MKVIPVILTYFFVSEISAYSFTKIYAIGNEFVRFVGFDVKGNTYAVTDLKKLYKLNPSNEMSSIIYLPYSVGDMLVGNRGDVYFAFVDDDRNRKLGILPKNSAEIEGLYGISPKLFYLDKNDNFFYCRNKGIYAIRPNSTISVPVKNLENFVPHYNHVSPVSDKSSNIYMLLQDQESKNYSLAFITKEALQDDIPHATLINDLEVSASIQDLMIDEKDRFWISTQHTKDDKRKMAIKRFEDGKVTTIMTSTEQLISLLRTKERIYFQARNWQNRRSRLYYITEDDRFIEIPGLQNISNQIDVIKGLVNSGEQAYFYGTLGKFTSSLGPLISIKSNETKVTQILLSSYDVNLASAKLDFNEDLWSVGPEGLFHLIKGETVASVPCHFNDYCNIPSYSREYIHINFVTKRIYISCSEGLFTVETLFK